MRRRWTFNNNEHNSLHKIATEKLLFFFPPRISSSENLKLAN